MPSDGFTARVLVGCHPSPRIGGFEFARPASCGSTTMVRMQLSDDDMRTFANDGYIVVRDVVAEPLLSAADAEIDELLETEPPVQGDLGPGPNLWFPPRARLPRCDDVLRRSGALDIADELVA